MKKFNKVLALGMAGSMALSMAACGGSSSSASTGTDGSSTSTAAPTAAPSKDVVTLKWVAVGSGMPSNYDAWLAQINPYLEDKIGVNIDMEVISWGDWDTRRNVIVNTSGEYDILFTNVNTYNNDVNTGAFLDITDMLKEAAPELYASVPEDYWKACEVGGRVYGVPTYKDSSQSEYVVWDKAKVEAAGYDYTKELGITVDMKYAYGNQFVGDADITAAMDTWYQGGTEIVFACGGGIYTSAVEAALKSNGYVVGVDVDQNYIGVNGVADGSFAYNPFITSAMKGLTEAVNTALSDIEAGDWSDIAASNGNFGLEDGDYVGLPTDADSWNFETFTTDEYEALKEKIKSGEITVDNSSDDSTKPTVSEFTTVNYIQ